MRLALVLLLVGTALASAVPISSGGRRVATLAKGAAASVRLREIGDFQFPVGIDAPPGDRHRLFVLEQRGRIQVLVDGVRQKTPFLNIRKLVDVHVTPEKGLLGLAFAPDYSRSGRFYVFYNDHVRYGNVNVVEYRRGATADRANPHSARRILYIRKPWVNHNGGMLQFGPDGYLYIGVGDGDDGHFSAGATGQDRSDLLGDILRIDPRHGDRYSVPSSNPFRNTARVRPEIWDYGLRNPWRFWIDAPTGDMYIADVGAEKREEIDYVRGNRGGLNFGWVCYEGTFLRNPTAKCPNAVFPVLEYRHTKGRCVVIGGVVARDRRIPSLRGRYLYADFCTGELRSFRIAGGRAVEDRSLGLKIKEPDTFGVDGAGRIYVASWAGPVYRLDPGGAER